LQKKPSAAKRTPGSEGKAYGDTDKGSEEAGQHASADELSDAGKA
jgi:hypothetical protein